MKPLLDVNTSGKKIMILLIVTLVLNSILAVWNVSVIYLHQAQKDGVELAPKQIMANDLLEYNKSLAQDMEVQDRSAVREALASFSYEIDLAEDGDELARVIFNQGRQVQEIIFREWDERLRDNILHLLNQDKNLQEKEDKVEFTLNISLEEGIEADPPVVSETTLNEILELYEKGGARYQERVFQVEFEDGESSMAVPYDPLDYIQSLTEELDSLRVTLHEKRVQSGYAEMSGPGIVIKIFDVDNGGHSNEIIHDSDVRDIVNELFASGARGVAVGDQRLVATSAIRCVGPVIMVNQEEVAANPVVIEAVGDPEVLTSGLDIIRFSMEYHHDFEFEVEKKDEVVLPPYRN